MKKPTTKIDIKKIITSIFELLPYMALTTCKYRILFDLSNMSIWKNHKSLNRWAREYRKLD